MSISIPVLSTKELQARLGSGGIALVDIRPADAYNGWRCNGELRGGHIASAKSLPLKWFSYLDWPDIVAAKKLKPDTPLVIYGYKREETEKAAERFLKAGFGDVMVYHDIVTDWASDSGLPLERLKRYRQLVSAEWLRGLLKNGTAPEYDNGKFAVCHAHYRNKAAYDEGHIPGAIEIDTNLLESPETWNRRTPGELKSALESFGIRCDTTVILYGRFSFPDNRDPFPGSSAGHLGAMRCAFIMLYAGVKDVRILNGGLQAWQDAGFKTVTAETPKVPVSDFGCAIPQHPELVVDTPEAKKIIEDPDGNLVSIRSWREFLGEVSGYNYIEKKGRIPGAVFGNCGSDAYHMENYRSLDHCCREYHEIETIWEEAGITAGKYNAFYCGTGWRGSEAFLNAWLMGWPRIAVYDGGWFEWSNDETNPIETGMPNQETKAVMI